MRSVHASVVVLVVKSACTVVTMPALSVSASFVGLLIISFTMTSVPVVS